MPAERPGEVEVEIKAEIVSTLAERSLFNYKVSGGT